MARLFHKRTEGGTLKFPSRWSSDALNGSFDRIGEVVEEVDAGERLQFGHRNDVLQHSLLRTFVPIVLVFEPKTDGGIRAVLDFEQSHEVVFGHGQSLGSDAAKHVGLIDGASLHHIEGVGKVGVAPEGLHMVLQRAPIILVELRVLRTHVGDVERLVVGFARIEAVGRGAKVAMVVAFEAQVVGEGVLHGELGVARILRADGVRLARHVAGTRVAIETEGHPSRVVERGVVGIGIVEHRVAAGPDRRRAVDHKDFVGILFERRHFQAGKVVFGQNNVTRFVVTAQLYVGIVAVASCQKERRQYEKGEGKRFQHKEKATHAPRLHNKSGEWVREE